MIVWGAGWWGSGGGGRAGTEPADLNIFIQVLIRIKSAEHSYIVVACVNHFGDTQEADFLYTTLF